jgi:PAS domain S-box-containing protein
MSDSRHPHSYEAALPFLAGGGAMGELTRAFDWSQTPVGPAAQWPQSLKTIVRTMLDSRLAMWLGWGPELTFFYNDAYAAMTLGPKHPWALGKPARVAWSEIWPAIGPRVESVLHTGKATSDEGLLLFLERRGFKEETYYTFSYSPVPDDHVGIGGMLCVVTEDTERTIGERRLRTLRELAARTNDDARSVEEACGTAARILAGNPQDVPFAQLYRLDAAGSSAALVGSTGVEPDEPVSPTAVELSDTGAPWPLREVVESGQGVVVEDLAKRFPSLPARVWPEPPTRAVVLPLARPGQTRLAGFVVAGVSARRPLDDDYRGFFALLAGQIATAVASGAASEEERRRAAALAASLAELGRATTAFFSNLGREFRTPLTLLLGPVEDLLARPASEARPDNRALLEVVHRNGLRLEQLVNTLLDFSGIEAGRSKAVDKPTDLGEFTADLASSFRAVCEKAGLEWTADSPPLAFKFPPQDLDGRSLPAGTSSGATDQKHAIDAQRRLAAIVESSHDAIMSLDLDGTLTSWNHGAERLYGYMAEEIIGRPIAVLIPPDHTDDFPAILERLRRGEPIDHFETVRLAKDGTRVDVSLTVSPLLDDAGQVVGASKIARDITERRRFEQALQDADRRKDEFLATLAHELRNPLAPLRNGLQVMKLARGNAELVEQSRAMMERQLGQMVRLVDDLLDVSRISRGKITLHPERVELAAVAQQAVETSRPLIDASRHDLSISIPPEPIYVDADVTRLAQVFSNLLNNSARYTEPGGRITLRIERQGPDAVVTVQDTGVGIPPHMLPSVFQMFTQVDRSLERSQGGLGIGLSIVKRLTEMHGGTVEAHSAGYGLGSKFIVRLPVVLSVAGDQHADAAAPATVIARRRVLVVDDNRDAASSLAMMLTLMGNETQTAHDGLQALDVAAALRPDVIFLDIGMPGLNGYETARRIRAEPWGQSPLLIALTGWGQEDDRRRSQEAGFDAHLTKPIDPLALEKLLAGRHSHIA